MEDLLLFGNILDNAKPPRKYRERLLTIDELTDKEQPLLNHTFSMQWTNTYHQKP